MTIVTMSASVHGLKPLCDERNVCHPTGLQIAVFFVGLHLIALGTGGISLVSRLLGLINLMTMTKQRRKRRVLSSTGSIFRLTLVPLLLLLVLFGFKQMLAGVGALASQLWLWPLLSSVSLQVVGCIDTKGLEGVR